jgi:hypothetical protein
MAKQRARVIEESGGAPLPVPEPKKLQKRYYAGLQLPSPQGGFLELLRVRPEGDKSATALFECNTSSLRYSLPIPAATRAERKKVKEQQEEGVDPNCPRHGPGTRLSRVGSELVCSLCGVAYGKV